MKSMPLLTPGIMVSLCALALIASVASSGVCAQSQRAGSQGWSMPRVATSPPNGPPLQGGQNQAVPRGDLRGDIADHARQRASPSRPAPPEQRRR
ncbi:hypothetical protein [Paraburkholderia adhaesiva]|uniref:hypothetical protein n=1 Tax=Paraburkholderia adhaesiva TaxID=2883244 RepID=UPI001F3C1E90|nr:hypothetical protein [Paraburkholderia adhaesiva]